MNTGSVPPAATAEPPTPPAAAPFPSGVARWLGSAPPFDSLRSVQRHPSSHYAAAAPGLASNSRPYCALRLPPSAGRAPRRTLRWAATAAHRVPCWLRAPAASLRSWPSQLVRFAQAQPVWRSAPRHVAEGRSAPPEVVEREKRASRLGALRAGGCCKAVKASPSLPSPTDGKE